MSLKTAAQVLEAECHILCLYLLALQVVGIILNRNIYIFLEVHQWEYLTFL